MATTMLNDDVRRRLREFLAAYKETGVNMHTASLTAGLSSSYLSQLLGPKRKGSTDGVIKVVEAVDHRYVEWVVFGKGDAPARIARPKGFKVIGAIAFDNFPSLCRVVGIGGAGLDGSVSYDASAELGYVRVPPGGSSKTVAIEVRGSSMRGVAESGWFVYHDEFEDGVRPDHIGQLCVVELASGETLVKTVQPGRVPDHYDLQSTSAEVLMDKRVARIAFVAAILPPRSAKHVLRKDGDLA